MPAAQTVPARRRAVHRCLALLVGLAVLAIGLATPHAAAAAVPRCRDLGRVPTGTQAWIGDHSERSQLVTNADRLVCSAADYSTIDLKSWFIVVDGTAMRHFVYDLALMHRYHHVTVNVHVGRNAYVRVYHYHDWVTFRRAFAFAHVYWCANSCLSTDTPGSSHAKWIRVSHLRQGGNAVLSTSMNFATQQFRTGQTGLFIARNPNVSAAFAHRFATYVTCARAPTSAACGARSRATQPRARGYGAHGTYVYFTPVSDDPIATELRRVTCTPASTHHLIVLASLRFSRQAVLDQLTRLRSTGCTIRILVEHAPSSVVEPLHPRCAINHDKTLIIDTARTRVVYSGAEDFVGVSLQVSDNQTVGTGSPGARYAYERYYSSMWARGRSC